MAQGLKSDSHLPKNLFYLFQRESFFKNAFYLILKARFALKIFKLLSCLFGHVEKTWLEKYGQFQNLWRHSLVKKQLQNTYGPISHEVKAIRNLVR